MTIATAVPGIPGATMRQVEELPADLPDSSPAGPLVQARPGQLLLVQPGVGRFLARDGDCIEFVREPDADPGLVSLILHGTARGALIHQRGELPLHAATLVPPGRDEAVAICGASGAGKSTLGAELSRRGWTLVADDTTRVSWDGTRPLVWPSRDSIKLWRDACDVAGVDPSQLERVARGLDKYYVHVPSLDRPVALGAIGELTGPGEGMLSAGDKMALISRHTYRASHIQPLGMQRQHVRLVARLASACRMFTLPGDKSLPVGKLADAIETMVP